MVGWHVGTAVAVRHGRAGRRCAGGRGGHSATGLRCAVGTRPRALRYLLRALPWPCRRWRRHHCRARLSGAAVLSHRSPGRGAGATFLRYHHRRLRRDVFLRRPRRPARPLGHRCLHSRLADCRAAPLSRKCPMPRRTSDERRARRSQNSIVRRSRNRSNSARCCDPVQSKSRRRRLARRLCVLEPSFNRQPVAADDPPSHSRALGRDRGPRARPDRRRNPNAVPAAHSSVRRDLDALPVVESCRRHQARCRVALFEYAVLRHSLAGRDRRLECAKHPPAARGRKARTSSSRRWD